MVRALNALRQNAADLSGIAFDVVGPADAHLAEQGRELGLDRLDQHAGGQKSDGDELGQT